MVQSHPAGIRKCVTESPLKNRPRRHIPCWAQCCSRHEHELSPSRIPHTSSAYSSVGFGASRNCTHLLPYPHSPRCRSFHGTFCRFARHQYDPHDSDRHRACSDRDFANSYCGHKKTSHTCRYHRISSGHNKAFWLISWFSHTDHNEAWIPFCLSFLPSRTFSIG